jgi:hypothetical protein
MIRTFATVIEVPTILLEKTKAESSKTEQQSKLQNSPIAQELSRIASAPAVTPKNGRRMANVLDDVLKPSKVVTPAPTKMSKDKAEELEKAIDESSAPDYVNAGPSEHRPIEQVSESLPEKYHCQYPKRCLLIILDTLFIMLRGNN